MDTKIPDITFPRCSKVNVPVTSIHIETGGELGRSLLDSYRKHSLEDGEGLCYRVRERGAQEWFKYREEEPPELAGPSITEHLISGLLVVLGLGFVVYLLSTLGRAAFETSIVPPPPAKGADAEGPAAAPVPRGVYEVKQDSWKKEGWWEGLSDSEREMVRMVIEQDLGPRLEDRNFVEMFVKEGRVSGDGIAYLIDSRNGTLRGRTNMRIGSLRVSRRTAERTGRRVDVVDVKRFLRRGRK